MDELDLELITFLGIIVVGLLVIGVCVSIHLIGQADLANNCVEQGMQWIEGQCKR